jgi:uncharacterized protein YmfQ (DUF2313 family)
MPPGAAWRLESDSVLSAFMLAVAEELARVDGRAEDLMRELDPRTTTELLPDWERVMGLPDPCVSAAQTIQERRAAIVAKLTTIGGQSRQFFIGLAAALGYVITITEFNPFLAGHSVAGDALTNGDWQHAWQVGAPETTVRDFRAGQSAAGEALRDWGNEELECAISSRAPAHTIPIFAYGP